MGGVVPWINTAIFVLLIFALMVFMSRKEKKEMDYRLFFMMGVIWLAIGLIYPFVSGQPFELSGLTALGLIFTIVGLANKSRWQKQTGVVD